MGLEVVVPRVVVGGARDAPGPAGRRRAAELPGHGRQRAPGAGRDPSRRLAGRAAPDARRRGDAPPGPERRRRRRVRQRRRAAPRRPSARSPRRSSPSTDSRVATGRRVTAVKITDVEVYVVDPTQGSLHLQRGAAERLDVRPRPHRRGRPRLGRVDQLPRQRQPHRRRRHPPSPPLDRRAGRGRHHGDVAPALPQGRPISGRAACPTAVVSGIDIALWDIKGKVAGRPVYDLLGGKVRDSVPLYANGWFAALDGQPACATPEDYAAAARRIVARGHAASSSTRSTRCCPYHTGYLAGQITRRRRGVRRGVRRRDAGGGRRRRSRS